MGGGEQPIFLEWGGGGTARCAGAGAYLYVGGKQGIGMILYSGGEGKGGSGGVWLNRGKPVAVVAETRKNVWGKNAVHK